MTPKQKATELVEKFIEYTPADEEYELPYAIECAKIAVEEILKVIRYHGKDIGEEYTLKDWKELKQELEKL